MSTKYLTPQDLADRYGLSLRTIFKWSYEGRGPKAVKLGTGRTAPLRFRLSDVEAWEAANEKPAVA